MGFHQRKLLHQHQYRDSSEAAMASPTPSPSPSPSPSPLQSPVPLPTMELPTPWFPLFVIRRHHIRNDDHEHVHVLRVAMIVMACVVGMLMLLFTISIIVRNYYSRRRNHNNNSRRRNPPILFDVNGDSPVVSDADEGPIIDHPIWYIRTEGLQQSLIDSITVFKYRKEEGLIHGAECSVCLGEFEQDESLRLLPKCSHAFHIPCIDTWLRSHKNCPLCRTPVAHDAAAAAGGSSGSGSTVEESATGPDSNVSGQNQENHIENFDGGAGTHHLGESEGSALRIGDDDDDDSGILSSEDGGGDSENPDKILPNFDKVNCNASILIGSQEVEEEIQPIRRSVSMDSSSASMIFHDVVHLNSDLESSSSDTHLDDKINSSSKDVIIAKQDSGSSSSTIDKLASIGRALQKRPISLRGSFSHNRRFLFSRHCRSQSSTLPL